MNPCCSAVRFTMEVPKNIHRRRRFRDSVFDRSIGCACGYDVRENAGKKKGERKGRKNWEKKRFESKIRKEKTRDKIRKTLIRYSRPFPGVSNILYKFLHFLEQHLCHQSPKNAGGAASNQFNSIQFNGNDQQAHTSPHRNITTVVAAPSHDYRMDSAGGAESPRGPTTGSNPSCAGDGECGADEADGDCV
jgi:hypothetical protein